MKRSTLRHPLFALPCGRGEAQLPRRRRRLRTSSATRHPRGGRGVTGEPRETAARAQPRAAALLAGLATLAIAAGSGVWPGHGAPLSATVLTAGEPRGGTETFRQAADPVVREVARMLEGKIPEAVITRWLDKSGKRPAAVSSEDLVLLRRLGASAELMEKLIELSGAPSSAGAAGAAGEQAGSSAAGSGAPAGAVAGEAAGTPASSGTATGSAPSPRAGEGAEAGAGNAVTGPSSGAAAVGPAGGAATAGRPAGNAQTTVPAHFVVSYQPFFGENDEPWHLFVYLDGRYLSSSKPAAISLTRTELSFDRNLAPGPHILRLVQERHYRRPLSKGWENEARVAPAELGFELRPAGGAEVEVRFQQMSIRRSRGPISLRVVQPGTETIDQEPQIPAPKDWPALCEEVESGVPPGKAPSAAARHQLAHCLRWDALWPQLPGIPSRGEVRARLESLGFRPGPGPVE